MGRKRSFGAMDSNASVCVCGKREREKGGQGGGGIEMSSHMVEEEDNAPTVSAVLHFSLINALSLSLSLNMGFV